MIDTTALDVNKIILLASKHFDVSVPYIRGPERTEKAVLIRRVVIHTIRTLLKDQDGTSLKALGRLMGRHHTTILHHVQTAEYMMNSDCHEGQTFRKHVADFQNYIRERVGDERAKEFDWGQPEGGEVW